jgi:hypothetical protein
MVVETTETLWLRCTAWMRSAHAERLLRGLIVVGSLFFVALFLYESLRRLRYPFDLEWIESGVLLSVSRIAHGQPLYARPSADYVPFLYAPLYFYVCAAVSKLTGLSFVATRSVSICSALATQALLFAFVRRETRNNLAAIASAGIYASLYFYIEGWVDIGRVDAFFILLFLLAIYCTRFSHPLVAAAVWILAFQTKQSVLPLAALFLLNYWDRKRPARLVMALGGYALLVWASIAWMQHLSGGWYRFYVFGTIHGLPGVIRLAALYPSEILLTPLAVTFAVITAAMVIAPVSLRSRRTVFYASGSIILYLAFWYVRAHRGYGNTMQAVYVWTALLFGMALARLLAMAQSGSEELRAPLTNALLLAVLCQLGSQIYNPGQFVPSHETFHDREQFEAQLRAIPGDVYVVNHAWDAVLAGKPTHADAEAAGAVADAGGPESYAFKAQMRALMMGGKLGAIAIDGGNADNAKFITPQELSQFPVHVPAAGADKPRFLTSQPMMILLPCSSLANGVAARVSLDGVAPATPECR